LRVEYRYERLRFRLGFLIYGWNFILNRNFGFRIGYRFGIDDREWTRIVAETVA
jgi:hypothetical protein